MDTKYTVAKNAIHTIRSDDPDFMITDGFRTSVRAGFEIENNCPESWRAAILKAIDHGWLKPVAYIHETELVWGKLQR